MRVLIPALITLSLTACTSSQEPPGDPAREYGPDPALTEPEQGLLPTTNVLKAVGWPEGKTPVAAPGLSLTAFAADLAHPRWVYELPNGDVLVAESDRPANSLGITGIKGWLAKKMMSAGGAKGASADRITLLRDADADGIAEVRSVLLDGLTSPFGMALVGEWLYVANADALVRVPYETGMTQIEAAPELVTALPSEPFNHHWTKSLLASPDGERLYVGVGSNSNIAENGMDAEQNRAAILEIDPATGDSRVFAGGLRNPVGLAWEPQSGVLWTVVNERDELGDQLVPDYMTSVTDGAFYGWPWSYWGQTVDTRVEPQQPDKVATAIAPDYALGAHTASLGLDFYTADAIPSLTGSAIIGQHGSWNRRDPSGYKVISVAFENGQPVGTPVDVLSGFLTEENEAMGRPAGVLVAADGAILVADDAGNTIWRVQSDAL